MKFLIISHTPHKREKDKLFAYGPYIQEMNLWLKHVHEVEIMAPFVSIPPSEIDLEYIHSSVHLNQIPKIEFTSIKKIIWSILRLPNILFLIFKACQRADHIHLRCPGNIGLLGCFVQVFFPNKIKTAKYAGNWDPKSQQPLSYKLQKWILGNRTLTKNMQVLVYGHWQNQTKNITPFFTASFSNAEIAPQKERDYYGMLQFVFIGSLVKGKRPLLAIKLIEALHVQGKKVKMDFYGDGPLKYIIKDYIKENNLGDFITLRGNQNKEVIKEALKQSHFLILASKSEGWPKAIAEAMFFGTIPIATKISCVPYMLDYGRRGIFIEPDLKEASISVTNHLDRRENLKFMSKSASVWSQKYTLDVFETEIVKLLKRK